VSAKIKYMTTFLTILAVVIIALLAYLIFIFKKPQQGTDSLLMLQQHIQDIQKTVDDKLGKTHDQMQVQFSQSAKIIRDVTERLTKLDDTNKQVIGFAEQLQSLENILKNPKQRGILGEYFLETLLKNVFAPNQYEMQYKFKDGEIVDAVIFLKDHKIPVDSKFSLENYNKIVEEKDPVQHEQLEKQFKQDLRNRIDETAKYIRPNEGTTDFAFMFIPSEGIYYDLLVNQVGALKVNTRDLIEYAFKDKRVIIVSPTSFYAYLQTVIQGFKKMQIEEQTKEIIKNVEKLGKHLGSYDEFMRKVGNNLSTTVNMYNSAYKEFKKIDKDVLKISGEGGEIEVLEIDKPQD